MIRGLGIDGPSEVEEGSTEEIVIHAPESHRIRVTVPSTGESKQYEVGPDGKARFPLPPGTRAGSYLLIVDVHDPTAAHEILVVPATDD